ncbi:MAG: lytic transglycosylase domain-containing protein [Desulfobacteraceae bacterium]|nr:MAG: lytic transglycosylase domain-containing protein [Desulfobacteraceae bacterium]
MILNRPVEISTACLLRVAFLMGGVVSIFLSPQEIARKQWLTQPAGHKNPKVVKKIVTPSPPPLNIDDYISEKTRKAEKEYQHHIFTVSKKHRIDPALVKAIILVESGYNPYAVSPKGAVGLMQLMPHVIDEFGIKDAFDPVLNIDGGVRYLNQLLKYFKGNMYLSLAAYNAGIGRVAQPGPIPSVTKNFVRKVLEFYEYYQRGGERKAPSDDGKPTTIQDPSLLYS